MKKFWSRKVQILGGSAFLNLPMKWIQRKNVKKGDYIVLEETNEELKVKEKTNEG